VGQFLDRVLDGVAEADLAEAREAFRERPGVDRHRVDVLEEERVGAELGHVLRDGPEVGHRARPRMMPPTPRVSAMVWRRPYCLGISKSITVEGR
jgi:hypothetical protein